jgi:hypothetical protein
MTHAKWKIKMTRQAWQMAEIVECLPSKCEDVSSNPSTAQKINKNKIK